MSTGYTVKDKTVIVTGGAAGIGRGICEILSEHGAIVYAGDINEQNLEAIHAANPTIKPIRMNVSREEDFKQAIEQVVAEHGRLDILINNAGIALAGSFIDTSMEDIEKIVAINYWSVIYGTKLAYEQMATQGHGHILNVSSSGGLMPVPNQAMYSGIKHAVTGFSHSLREEAALKNVKVGVIFPGMVQSDLWDNATNVKDYNMKKNMESTGLKPITAREAGEAVLKGIEADQRSIIFPRVNRFIVRLYQMMPNLMNKIMVAPLAKQ